MNYAIELLKRELNDVESVQKHCLQCGNQTDSDTLEEQYTKDLRIGIRLLETAVK